METISSNLLNLMVVALAIVSFPLTAVANRQLKNKDWMVSHRKLTLLLLLSATVWSVAIAETLARLPLLLIFNELSWSAVLVTVGFTAVYNAFLARQRGAGVKEYRNRLVYDTTLSCVVVYTQVIWCAFVIDFVMAVLLLVVVARQKARVQNTYEAIKTGVKLNLRR